MTMTGNVMTGSINVIMPSLSSVSSQSPAPPLWRPSSVHELPAELLNLKLFLLRLVQRRSRSISTSVSVCFSSRGAE